MLFTGRVAKKATEGSSWIWALDVDEEHFEPEYLGYLLSRVSVQETEGVDTPRVSLCSYSFGNWGYHTNEHDSELMPGFSSTPPGAEICGHYKVTYIAALRFVKNKQRANIILRQQPKNDSILIKKSSEPFTIGVDGRLGTLVPLRSVRRVTSPTIFDGEKCQFQLKVL